MKQPETDPVLFAAFIEAVDNQQGGFAQVLSPAGKSQGPFRKEQK